MTESAPTTTVRIGVLALQGSFREHIRALQSIAGVDAVEVRTQEELSSCQGLIIPGGESTTMALVAERWGLLPELKKFTEEEKPVWGTCAGMIFLAERAVGQKEGGQALIGGLDVLVSRNFFGAQIDSFETHLPAPTSLLKYGSDDTFRAVFIRAPAVLEWGPNVQQLSKYRLTSEEAAVQQKDEVTVAVQSGHLLATAFHPELTADRRWHHLFVDMVRASPSAKAAEAKAALPAAEAVKSSYRPADLPVYGVEFSTQVGVPAK